jgi:hypothetical protein
MPQMTEEERAAHGERIAAGKRAAEERRQAERAEVAARAAAAPEPDPIPMPPIVHEGVGSPTIIGDPPAEDPDDATLYGPVEDAEPDDFERFLAAQDDEIRDILSDVELRVIYEAETKRAAEEKKANAKKLAVARAQRHAKATAGLLGPEAIAAAALRDRLAQKVRWTVNMPEAGNSGMLIDQGIRINGRLLQHGQEITGTLAEYESYRAIEWNAHQNELDFQGRGKLSKLRQTATGFINMKGASL